MKFINLRIVLLLMLVFLVGCQSSEKKINETNKENLRNSILSLDEGVIALNDTVPFDWDVVYTFEPYTSKEEIESQLGIKSNLIRETVSEGMLHLVFVKDNKVVLSIASYLNNIGYNIIFDDKILYTDNTNFNVIKNGDIVTLTIILD